MPSSSLKSRLQRGLLNLAYGIPRKAHPPFSPEQIRKVLVIRRNGLGDMICTLPLLRNIREAWPHVRLDVLASEKNAILLAGTGLADDVFLFRKGKGLFRNRYLQIARSTRAIRKQEYDLVIAAKCGFSPLLGTLTYATHIPWRLGYVPTRGHTLDFCFNMQIQLPREREHQVESCLRFLEPLGISQTSCDLSFTINPEHEEYAEHILRKAGLSERSFVLFNVSSERYESRWTAEKIAATATELHARFGLRMVLCGIKRDLEFIQTVESLAPAAIPTSATPPSIHYFAALTRLSRFLMCGDGGPMHVGAAMKTPVFVLFSATDPTIWRPYGVPFAYVHQGRLVANITPAEVVARVEEWLPTF